MGYFIPEGLTWYWNCGRNQFQEITRFSSSTRKIAMNQTFGWVLLQAHIQAARLGCVVGFRRGGSLYVWGWANGVTRADCGLRANVGLGPFSNMQRNHKAVAVIRKGFWCYLTSRVPGLLEVHANAINSKSKYFRCWSPTYLAASLIACLSSVYGRKTVSEVIRWVKTYTVGSSKEAHISSFSTFNSWHTFGSYTNHQCW